MNGKLLCIFLTLSATVFAVVFADGFTTITEGTLILDVSDYELPWADAVATCRSMNKTLISVENEEKDRLLVDLFVNGAAGVTLPGSNSWTSAHENKEGAWEWESTGEPLFHQRWYIGQPDDLTSLNCAYQAVAGLLYWRDANCSAPMYFICESQA